MLCILDQLHILKLYTCIPWHCSLPVLLSLQHYNHSVLITSIIVLEHKTGEDTRLFTCCFPDISLMKVAKRELIMKNTVHCMVRYYLFQSQLL